MTEFIEAHKDVKQMLRNETDAMVKFILNRIIEIGNNIPDDPQICNVVFNSLVSGVFGKILAIKFDLNQYEMNEMEEFFDSFAEATYEYFEILTEMNRSDR